MSLPENPAVRANPFLGSLRLFVVLFHPSSRRASTSGPVSHPCTCVYFWLPPSFLELPWGGHIVSPDTTCRQTWHVFKHWSRDVLYRSVEIMSFALIALHVFAAVHHNPPYSLRVPGNLYLLIVSHIVTFANTSLTDW